jgi:hypothetical protein
MMPFCVIANFSSFSKKNSLFGHSANFSYFIIRNAKQKKMRAVDFVHVPFTEPRIDHDSVGLGGSVRQLDGVGVVERGLVCFF